MNHSLSRDSRRSFKSRSLAPYRAKRQEATTQTPATKERKNLRAIAQDLTSLSIERDAKKQQRVVYKRLLERVKNQIMDLEATLRDSIDTASAEINDTLMTQKGLIGSSVAKDLLYAIDSNANRSLETFTSNSIKMITGTIQDKIRDLDVQIDATESEIDVLETESTR